MSLKMRCSRCGRGTSGKHNLCSDCRGPSVERVVYVAQSGERFEVTTIEPMAKPSSSRPKRRESRASRTAAGRAGEIPGVAYVPGENYVRPRVHPYEDRYESYIPGVAYVPGENYVRPRVHPHEDRYEYIPANVQYAYPPQTGGFPTNAHMYAAPPSHGVHWQQPNGAYHPQTPYAPARQIEASGQNTQLNYVYAGTEGPDGEIID